jgi:hypothetical protein
MQQIRVRSDLLQRGPYGLVRNSQPHHHRHVHVLFREVGGQIRVRSCFVGYVSLPGTTPARTDYTAEDRHDWHDIVNRAFYEGRIGNKGLEPSYLNSLLYAPPQDTAYPVQVWRSHAG